MKNILESFAVSLVGILSLLIVYLIVQYNMIKDDNFIEKIPYVTAKSKKESTKDYLSEMEHYSDVDVQVDPTQEDITNSVSVKPELVQNTLSETVEDRSKSSYIENLDTDTDSKKKAVVSQKDTSVKPIEDKVDIKEGKSLESLGSSEQRKAIEEMGNALDSIVEDTQNQVSSSSDASSSMKETIDDEIGMAIDAALEDL